MNNQYFSKLKAACKAAVLVAPFLVAGPALAQSTGGAQGGDTGSTAQPGSTGKNSADQPGTANPQSTPPSHHHGRHSGSSSHSGSDSNDNGKNGNNGDNGDNPQHGGSATPTPDNSGSQRNPNQ